MNKVVLELYTDPEFEIRHQCDDKGRTLVRISLLNLVPRLEPRSVPRHHAPESSINVVK